MPRGRLRQAFWLVRALVKHHKRLFFTAVGGAAVFAACTVLSAAIVQLITDDLIEEHRQSPTGLHSDSLERLMLFFRKSELAGKYCVYALEPFKQYRIVALSGLPGVPPRTVDDRVYTTIDDAYHAVFLRRVNDLRSS